MIKELFIKLTSFFSGKSNSIKGLHFKDNQSAFEYICMYGVNTIKPESSLVAIVLPGPNGEEPYRLETGMQRAMLKVASDDGGFLVIADTFYKYGPLLKVGDLVSWMPTSYASELSELVDDKRFAWIGFIMATLEPHLNNSGWKIKDRFRK